MSENFWLTTYTNTRENDCNDGNDSEELFQDLGENTSTLRVGITTHYYWSSDQWTIGKDNDCSYVQKLSLLSNPLLRPEMLVIEPNSLENINLLGYYDSLKHSHAQRTRHGMGHFRNYVYFSKQCTSSLKMLIDPESTLIDPQRVFQFESRYFQYSLLQNKITFVHTRQRNAQNIEEYLVFRFWHRSKNDKGGIFGIAKRTQHCSKRNGHIYQPWQCVEIVEQSQMLGYFGLAQASKNSQNEFLSLLPTPVECYEKPFNNSIDCEFDPNFNKIGGILRRGYDRYRDGMWDNFSDDSHNSYRSRFRKNEPKFEYLDQIAMEMKLSFDELIGEILNAIQKAFYFAKAHPEHVLTQAYIDEQNCQIFYESVLLAELTSKGKKSKTYTFGVPIVSLMNEDDVSAPPCYLAESVLTPQMTIENIMLNTRAEKFDKMKQESWISRMLTGKSFYALCNGKGESSFYYDYETPLSKASTLPKISSAFTSSKQEWQKDETCYWLK